MASLPIPQEEPDLLHQVHLPSVPDYSTEQTQYRTALRKLCPEVIWPPGSLNGSCPRPIVVTHHHERKVHELNEALVLAITDIVQRWWKDDDAKYYERMPLERYEEELLRWMETQVKLGNIPKYSSACTGSWRPDYMIENHIQDGGIAIAENIRITEINARFAFNAWFHSMYAQKALQSLVVTSAEGIEDKKFEVADGEEFLNGLLEQFDPNLPLHLLKGKERGMDIHMFIHELKERFGVSPRLIEPADLRLVPDPSGDTKWILCCLAPQHGLKDDNGNSKPFLTTANNERVEKIHRLALELHQTELAALNPTLLRQISLHCFNDLRTILLVHDKRMLGIVKQELQALVTRGVLTPLQARVLDLGIADTFLPGSADIRNLATASRLRPEVRFEWMLKPIRGGKGAGIRFGDEVGAEEWCDILERLSLPKTRAEDLGEAFVVQRVVVPRLYDVKVDASGQKHRYPIVGTFPVNNGRVRGWGGWKSSADRICAVCNGGAWMGTLMRRESGGRVVVDEGYASAVSSGL